MAATGFTALKNAARVRDVMGRIARKAIDELRPADRYGLVISIDAETNKANVSFNPTDPTDRPVPVKINTVLPPVGASVRVVGGVGDRYVAAVLTPPAWVPVTYQNGWTDYSAVDPQFQPVAYWRDAGGIVRLRGLGKPGTLTSGTVLFNLPATFRPPAHLVFPAACSAGHAQVDVLANGDVALVSPGAMTSLSFETIAFQATQ